MNPLALQAGAAAAGSLMNIAALASSVLADQEQSLIEYTSVVRQEPVALVEDGLIHLDVTPNILRTLTNLYMAYYLQAVSINNHVGNCSVMNTLDKFATHRSTMNAVGQFVEAQHKKYFSKESFTGRYAENQSNLPQLSKLSVECAKLCYPSVLNPDVESYQLGVEGWMDDAKNYVKNQTKEQFFKDAQQHYQQTNPAFGKTNPPDDKQQVAQAKIVADVTNEGLKSLSDAPNLALGKLFNVVIENEGRSAVIPVSVRINSLEASRLLMLKILAQGDLMNKMKERWNRWREGELRFFRDLVMCQDLIAEHAQLMKTDKHGIYKQILKRRRQNKAAEVMTGNVSVAGASSIAIVSKDTIDDLRLMVGGSIENKEVRANIFARCSLMFLVIVDPALQYATIYHRGIEHPMELTFSEFTKLGKGSGPDTLDILRAFQAGQRPNI